MEGCFKGVTVPSHVLVKGRSDGRSYTVLGHKAEAESPKVAAVSPHTAQKWIRL